MTREEILQAFADGTNLSGANLSGANLSGANLGWTNLSGANLRGANLSGANLGWTNLRWTNLSGANLSEANLRGAILSGAILSGANLSGANLGWTNLRGANLRGAILSGADLSGAIGLTDAASWLRSSFETDECGLIVYKAFGGTDYSSPSRWVIEPGSAITEVANPLPTLDCACGVNFATHEWCKREYPYSVIWRCRIEWMDLAGVVVPYNTNGKARCSRLVLIAPVE